MIEPRHRDGFLKETLLYYLIASVLLMKLFDGYDAAGRVDVFSLKDGTEPAAANVVSDLVTPYASAAHDCSASECVVFNNGCWLRVLSVALAAVFSHKAPPQSTHSPFSI